MLTETEVKKLLNDIENERVERTISTTNTDKFAQAVCAFANDIRNSDLPGFLFIGANDDGTLSGLTVSDELLRNLAGLRSDGNILPSPALMVYKMVFLKGEIAVVEVQPSKLPPVRYKGKTWIRIGARKAVANEEEERILTERRQVHSLTFDTQPCLEATIEDIDTELFQREYLPKAISPEILKQDKRTIVQQLASLRLYNRMCNCPTYAGILLLGTNPKYFIFGAYIQYVRFEGIDRTSKVTKEYQFIGNLIQMLKELDSFVKLTIENKRPVLVSALREKIVVNYPYAAIRELLMNSVMHRAYVGSNAPIKFYEYSDRIEIDNPGNLYGKVRIENFPYENDYRNPVLAESMKTLGYVNQFGRGVSMVQDALKNNGNEEAMFILDDVTSFKVIVKNADPNNRNADVSADVSGYVSSNVSGDVSDLSMNADARRNKILALMKQDKYISASIIASKLGVTPRTIYRDISKLKTELKIRRIGDEMTGFWDII